LRPSRTCSAGNFPESKQVLIEATGPDRFRGLADQRWKKIQSINLLTTTVSRDWSHLLFETHDEWIAFRAVASRRSII
jgi:hypothetical protein